MLASISAVYECTFPCVSIQGPDFACRQGCMCLNGCKLTCGFECTAADASRFLITRTGGIGKTAWLAHVMHAAAINGRTVVLADQTGIQLFTRSAQTLSAASEDGLCRQCCLPHTLKLGVCIAS